MAVEKTKTDSKLVIRVETGEVGTDGAAKTKDLSYSRIRPDAADEVLYAAGDAIGSLQSRTVSAIRRIDTNALKVQA